MSNDVRSPNASGQASKLSLPPVDTTSGTGGYSLPPDLLASLLADGDEQLVTWTLRTAIAERGRAAAYDDLLTGAMRLIGERWIAGQWGIAEEHLASQTIVHALDSVRPEPVADPTAPLAVLAGVSGEHHSIGLVCLAHILEEGGWTVANLGPDVPAADIATFAARQGAALVAITASLEERLPVVRETVAVLTAEGLARAAAADPSRPLAVIVGGRVAGAAGADLPGVTWAGASLAAAVPVLARIRKSLSDPS